MIELAFVPISHNKLLARPRASAEKCKEFPILVHYMEISRKNESQTRFKAQSLFIFLLDAFAIIVAIEELKNYAITFQGFKMKIRIKYRVKGNFFTMC